MKFRYFKVVAFTAAASLWASGAHADGPIETEIRNILIPPAQMATQPVSPDLNKNWLKTFYEQRDMKPIWIRGDDPNKDLRLYLNELNKAPIYGLDPNDYGYTDLLAALDRADARDLAQIDLIASRSFVNYVLDVREGRVSPRLDFTDEELDDRDIKRSQILKAVASANDPRSIVTNIRRDNPVQAGLVRALTSYEALAAQGSWEPIEMVSPKLELGSIGPDVVTIAERLRAEGFFDGDVAEQAQSSPNTAPFSQGTNAAETAPVNVALYDARLEQAVKDFQKSRGLKQDGIVGRNTLAAMNVTAAELADRIRLNLERARWLPQDFADRHILVNIAHYRVGLYENEQLQRTIKAVVGKYHEQTPVFASQMSYIVVNPYWNVTTNIMRNEIAPKVLEDPLHLQKKEMEVVDGWGDDAPVIDSSTVDWQAVREGRSGTIRIRQKPGAQNALGKVKFMFPNDYSVYLHDTPAQSLFARAERSFSHGCIRLDEPLVLAEWVLRDIDNFNKDDFDAQLASGERKTVLLDNEIPVYITYFTAWADPDGTVYFLDDIYNRDEPLARSLENAKPVIGQLASIATP